MTFHESEFYYSGGVSKHPLQGESSIFVEDTQIQIQQKVLEQLVSEQPVTVVQQDQELLRAPYAGTEQSVSEQPVIEVQQDQESLRTPDVGTSSDNFPSTTPTIVPSPYIQSGLDDFPQVIKHSNSNSITLPELSNTGNTSYQLPPHTTRGIPR